MCSAFYWPEIKTPRLALRSPRAEDAPRLAAIANDFDVARMTTSLPHPYSLADAEFVLGLWAERDPSREAVFAIEEADEGLVGIIGLHPRQSSVPSLEAPEIGYFVGRPYWRLGYATEAARAVLDWSAEEWDVPVVTSGHFADNPASGAVLCKAGFL
ncbi:MAG TPA: GNAT family N-acetyltransferase, partial [Caulobacteraceae bacterium]|nr:GNAT family N-acetyltransferase [Caulobacteraceae bacterium]